MSEMHPEYFNSAHITGPDTFRIQSEIEHAIEEQQSLYAMELSNESYATGEPEQISSVEDYLSLQSEIFTRLDGEKDYIARSGLSNALHELEIRYPELDAQAMAIRRTWAQSRLSN